MEGTLMTTLGMLAGPRGERIEDGEDGDGDGDGDEEEGTKVEGEEGGGEE